jgi:hypothetical protein
MHIGAIERETDYSGNQKLIIPKQIKVIDYYK